MTARDDRSTFRALLRPFPDQTRSQHLLVAAVGLAVWSGAFLALLAVLGGEGVATADTAGAVGTRRLAGVLAGVVCGAYFGVAFARERGGPVTNLLFAPLCGAAGATGAPIAAVYGTAPERVFSAAGPAGAVGDAVVLGAAATTAAVVVAVYLAVLAGPARRRRIEARFAELPGVHTGPRPLDDWRRADGGEEPGGGARAERDDGSGR